MADDQAEQAFLQGQVKNVDSEETPIQQQADSDEDDEYDPSSTFQSEYQISESAPQHGEDIATTDPNLNSTSDVDNGAVSDAPDPLQNSSRAESQMSTPVPPGALAQPQTRTIGGFEVEDDDEDEKDEADYEPPTVLEGDDDANAMPMTMSEDHSSGNANQNTSPDVPSHTAVQDPAMAQDAVHSSYSPVPVSNTHPSASGPAQWAPQNASLQNSTVFTPVPDSPSASRGRLPHDWVGMLQDRVDEDPRGDIPAWLELIAEHRARNRLDSAREVYEKFLKVFPMAVRLSLQYCFSESRLTDENRPINGWHMLPWSRRLTSSSAWSKFSAELYLPSPMSSCGLSTWTMFVAGTP